MFLLFSGENIVHLIMFYCRYKEDFVMFALILFVYKVQYLMNSRNF